MTTKTASVLILILWQQLHANETTEKRRNFGRFCMKNGLFFVYHFSKNGIDKKPPAMV